MYESLTEEEKVICRLRGVSEHWFRTEKLAKKIAKENEITDPESFEKFVNFLSATNIVGDVEDDEDNRDNRDNRE